MQSSLKITMKLACALAFYTCALAAQAQGYPDKPITIVVPFAAGSGTDQQARIFAQAMTNEYKVPVVVDNRVGASGIIAAQHVARAAPDGYTLLMTTNTTHAANTHLFKKLPYDPVKDFTPVTLLGKGQMMLVVPATSPIKSLPELLAAARQHPGKLNFGSGSSSSRVAGEMFKQLTGINVVNIPYKSNPMALTDLLGGQVDFMFADGATAIPQINSKSLRAFATSGTNRLAIAPSVPTVEETGVKDYDMTYWTAVYLPAHAAPDLIKRLNDIFVKIASQPAWKRFQDATAGEVATTSPEGLAKFQAAETQKWGRIIKTAGIVPQ
ncbi:MAG TPA: tripartite tricarboxylate transporter substrate binding protein [Advenella sp.]|nr:tripartite tricarboxylate transporter substrate binding protein [Advenella sp.]